MVRQQKGGTAVVLGALSPRTRNAQVELYQNGEVDYLIATDAIGMGLNMNINHVAFADNSKFDGRIPRYLSAQELAQAPVSGKRPASFQRFRSAPTPILRRSLRQQTLRKAVLLPRAASAAKEHRRAQTAALTPTRCLRRSKTFRSPTEWRKSCRNQARRELTSP